MAKAEHPYQSLAYYEAKAKTMTDAALDYAINDVRVTLDGWGAECDTDYTRRLWREWDAYTVERQRRRDRKVTPATRIRQPRIF